MKRILQRKSRRVRALLHSAAREGSTWAVELAGKAASLGLPESPSGAALQGLIRAGTVLLEHRLSEADEAHDEFRSCLKRLQDLRATRDEAARTLYRTLVRFRWMADFLVGEEMARHFFPPGRTPREPDRLKRLAQRVQRGLKAAMEEGGMGRQRAFDFDVRGFLVDLSAELSALEDARRGIQGEETAKRRASVRRRRAVSDLNGALQGVRQLFAGLSRLAC